MGHVKIQKDHRNRNNLSLKGLKEVKGTEAPH